MIKFQWDKQIQAAGKQGRKQLDRLNNIDVCTNGKGN